MKSLRRNEQELIFDYFLGFASNTEIEQAQELLKSSNGAVEFHEKLKSSLLPLEHYSVEACPDHLAEKTVIRLNMAAKASQIRLEHLLEKERVKSPIITKNRSFWSNFVEVAAVAAMIFIVAGISFPTLQSARQNYWKTKCGAQLASIATGMNTMNNADLDRVLAGAAPAAGSPWWKVGYQGIENQSNTRPLWRLVQQGYVPPEAFVCPARIQGRALKFDREQAAKLSDFPGRKYVTYSFRILCPNNAQNIMRGNRVIIADRNPVFENLPGDFQKELNVQLGGDMLKVNSTNHRGGGQNMLFSDGSVAFEKSRKVGIENDDIFTVKDQTHYRGIETPASQTDNFLAP
jgi:hypothetical protein